MRDYEKVLANSVSSFWSGRWELVVYPPVIIYHFFKEMRYLYFYFIIEDSSRFEFHFVTTESRLKKKKEKKEGAVDVEKNGNRLLSPAYACNYAFPKI